jgi:cytochrome c-type biogenesis protein
MDIGIGTYGLSFAAGVLSILSPCVLPLVPIVIGSAATAHRWGAMALVAGLALSFTVAGVVVATSGHALGIDGETLRLLGAVILLMAGVLLIASTLQARFAIATGGAGQLGESLLAKWQLDGVRGQFFTGALLGLVWIPCVGPTLGAAMALAARGSHVAEAASVMAVFAIGAAIPMVSLGFLSRPALSRLQGRMTTGAALGKRILGAVLIAVSLLVVSGTDQHLEAWLLDVAPDWLITITTRF